MKKQLFIVLFGATTLSLTGCYSQVAVREPVIIYYPVPEPDFLPEEPYYPPTNPVNREYKTRPIKRPPGENIRNPGKKRDPVTPRKRDDFTNPGKIGEPVTTPPSKDRIRDEIKNSGGRNDDGRKSRQ
jgi:hypothetical protein